MEPINTMSGEAIITLIALAVILVVFGIPLYVVHRRNRNQAEWPDQEQPVAEIAPVNDAGPQLTRNGLPQGNLAGNCAPDTRSLKSPPDTSLLLMSSQMFASFPLMSAR